MARRFRSRRRRRYYGSRTMKILGIPVATAALIGGGLYLLMKRQQPTTTVTAL